MTEEIQINLSEQILAAHAQAHAFAEQAKGYASDAVAKAVECGQLLIQQKAALGHGSWLDWLARNLPEIKRETVRKYMKIAKVAYGSIAKADKEEIATSGGNLKDASSLRQPFVAIGLLPVPENKLGALAPNKHWVRFTRYLNGLPLWLNKRTDEDPLKTWQRNCGAS
jgi:hypothetical protein